MKRIVYVMLLALSGCASPQLVPTSPKLPPPPVPAWILEPGPNLLQLLDALISPSAMESTTPPPSLPPAKIN